MATNEEIRAIQLAPTVFRRQAWSSEFQTQRNAILRDCPAGLAVDRAHALTRVAGVMQSGVGAPLARRYLIRGLLGDGHSRADVAQALAADEEEMARAQSELPISERHAKKLAALLARELPRQRNDEGYNLASSPGERRTGNLTRGSRGWRTPADEFPQTTTPPLG